jgi:hypothetical protein
LNDSIDEVLAYCEKNVWLHDVSNYISNWSPKTILEWKKIGSLEIEDQLNKVKAWIESIKNNIEKSFITNNGILRIDCASIEKQLVPKLEKIYTEICECILLEIKNDSLNFVAFIESLIKVSKIDK